MKIDVATIVSLLGALGVGSLLTQWVAGARDRRGARAKVLEALRGTETARWAPRKPDEPTFGQAMHELQAAALIARIPRRPVRVYLRLAQAAYWESVESWEQIPDPEVGGGVNMQFAEVVRDAARLVSDVTWTPLPLRLWHVRHRVVKLEARAAEISAAGRSIKEKLERARCQVV